VFTDTVGGCVSTEEPSPTSQEIIVPIISRTAISEDNIEILFLNRFFINI
jgi:hypothetical protein